MRYSTSLYIVAKVNAELTHLDADGKPRMVDVSEKSVTRRVAVAQANVRYPEDAWKTLSENGFKTKKGAVSDVARIAGVMATKRTAELIPFCHSLALDKCDISVEPENNSCSIVVKCTVATEAKTGVEMEALTGASVAALTLYDMTKSLSHGITIEQLSLKSKTGGKSDFQSE